MNRIIPQLTPEQIAAGVTIEVTPESEPSFVPAISETDPEIENMARSYKSGLMSIGQKREIKRLLEDKVVKRIGRKGKLITNKLFELIDGVYVLDRSVHDGRGGKAIKYYQVQPNLNAIIYALDRVLGKPTQYSETDVTSGGEKITIANILDQLIVPINNINIGTEEKLNK